MGHGPQPRRIDISGIVSGYVLRLARESIVATRRWLIGAVIVPVIGILLPVILLLTLGAGSS
ncbi:hypothetical protein [Streptomyces sp. NPDC059994]|uniref:hypothetical protein n=1 Tax=Streptomyces sp. NPDC059994 TaxID=3347029 RepID=UPI003673CD28